MNAYRIWLNHLKEKSRDRAIAAALTLRKIRARYMAFNGSHFLGRAHTMQAGCDGGHVLDASTYDRDRGRADSSESNYGNWQRRAHPWLNSTLARGQCTPLYSVSRCVASASWFKLKFAIFLYRRASISCIIFFTYIEIRHITYANYASANFWISANTCIDFRDFQDVYSLISMKNLDFSGNFHGIFMKFYWEINQRIFV